MSQEEDPVYDLFMNIIGIQEQDVLQTLLDKISKPYDASDDAYYIDVFNKLPSVSYAENESGALAVSMHKNNQTRIMNRINKLPKHKGAFGSVHKSTNQARAYKRITIRSPRDARNLLVEIFIQCVLSMDEVGGGHIPQPLGLLKESDSPLVVSLIMEYVGEGTTNDYLYGLLQTNQRALTLTDMYGLFEKVATILYHFNAAYGFRHNDLHMENLIINKEGAHYMIDFGKSCLTYRGTSYSYYAGKVPCKASDLLFFTVSILNNYYQFIEEVSRKYLIGVMANGELTAEGQAKFNTNRKYINSGAVFESTLTSRLTAGDPTVRTVFHLFDISNPKMPIGNPLYVRYPKFEPGFFIAKYKDMMEWQTAPAAESVQRSLLPAMNDAAAAAVPVQSVRRNLLPAMNAAANRLSGVKRRAPSNRNNTRNTKKAAPQLRRHPSTTNGGRRKTRRRAL
jgi:serine/threonine protein kinase